MEALADAVGPRMTGLRTSMFDQSLVKLVSVPWAVRKQSTYRSWEA